MGRSTILYQHCQHPPTTTSSGATGSPKDTYRTNEDVYNAGSGFAAGTNMNIYVVPDHDWNDGDQIPQDITADIPHVFLQKDLFFANGK